MPAGISETDGMAYVGKRPWHGLGVKVEADVMTAAEAIEATEMDWEVLTAPLTTMIDGKVVEIENYQTTYRNDTNQVLGVVGNRYQPVQNRATFDFFDAVVGNGDARYDTVGTLNGGKKVWLLAKFNNPIKMDNGDEIESYLLLHNSHDGSSSLTMQWCDIRVVCQNTFEMAKSYKGGQAGALKRFHARHTRNVMDKASQAREILQLQTAYRDQLEEEINLLAEKAWSAPMMERLALTLFGVQDGTPADKINGSVKANADAITDLYTQGLGNTGKTAWDAYNAVTEFTSHYKGYGRSVATLGSTDDAVVENRLNYNFFGDGVWTRAKAWDIVTSAKSTAQKKLVRLS